MSGALVTKPSMMSVARWRRASAFSLFPRATSKDASVRSLVGARSRSPLSPVASTAAFAGHFGVSDIVSQEVDVSEFHLAVAKQPRLILLGKETLSPLGCVPHANGSPVLSAISASNNNNCASLMSLCLAWASCFDSAMSDNASW